MRKTSGIDEYHAVNVRKRPSSTTADAAVPLPPREGFRSDKLKFVSITSLEILFAFPLVKLQNVWYNIRYEILTQENTYER